MADDRQYGCSESELTEKEVILLGLVAEEPIHAYGLEEKIRIRKMDLWTSIGFSSIYRVLSGLEEKGLIDAQLEHEGQGATRKVHTITDRGKQALARGVLDHLGRLSVVKNPFSVGLANIFQAPREAALEQLEGRASGLRGAERELTDMQERMLKVVDSAPRYGSLARARGRLAVQLVFSCARHHMQAERKFIGEAVERLKEQDPEVFEEIHREQSNPVPEDT